MIHFADRLEVAADMIADPHQGDNGDAQSRLDTAGDYRGGKQGSEDSGGFDGEGHERRTGGSEDSVLG